MATPVFDPDDYQTIPVDPDDSCDFYDLSCVGGWIQDQLTSFALWLYERILSGLASVIESIPVPDWMLNAGSLNVPGSVAWFASSFQLDTGMGIIVSAYLLRFVIRRIPFIG